MRVSSFLLVAVFLLVSTLQVYGQADPAASATPVNQSPGSPVMLGDEVVFYIKAAAGGWIAETRATSISERLKRLADDHSILTDTLQAHEVDVGTEIAAGDRFLMLVLNVDAQAEGVSRSDLAQDYIQKIRASIDRYRAERSRRNIMRGAIIALVATAALALLLFILSRLYRRIVLKASAWIESRATTIEGKSGEIIRRTTVKSSLLTLLRLTRLFIIFVFVYAYLDLVLRLFPWTRPFASRLTDYVLVPLARIGRSAVAEIPNIFFVLVVVVLTRYTLKFLRMVFAGIDNGSIKISGFYSEWAMPTYRIVRILVIAFAVVMAYPYIPGSESEAFKGISIFLGILVSLGSSSAVANIIAGLTMVYMRSFQVGDRVKIGDMVGDVMQTRLQVTHLRTIKNEEIIVPNSKIINSEVINYSSLARKEGLILHTEVTIGYDVPWRQVHALLLLAAEQTQGLLRDPAPFVLQRSLDDFYVRYELNAYTENPLAMAKLYSDIHMNIQDRFNEYDVQIMSPNYENDRAERAVVPKDRWYAAPAQGPEQVSENGDQTSRKVAEVI